MFSLKNEGRKGSGYIKNNMHEWNFYTFQLEGTYVPFVQLQNKRKNSEASDVLTNVLLGNEIIKQHLLRVIFILR